MRAQVGALGDRYKWGNTVLTKESPAEWKLYASGRQFCKHLQATLMLKRRQDLWSHLW